MDESARPTLSATHPALRETEEAHLAGPAVSLERGALVGRYVVLARVGSGGMGVVFAAYDPELDRKVAIKLLKVREGGSSRARARLQREAQALARLHHPNVVTVHDVGVHDGRVFLAMEFVEGRTLAHWLGTDSGGERRGWREVLRVFEAVGRGLAAAHAAGLVHRDVKPDNVMLGHDGRVVVMDFGLARTEPSDVESRDGGSSSKSARVSLTRSDAMVGTPAYMAPEQFALTPIDARSDQFSYCVALYEALYGVRPFAGETAEQLALSVTDGRLREAPRTSRVPSWLRAAVMRGLSHHPEDRFASMADLLDAFAAGAVRRRRNRQLIAVATVAIVAGGVVGLSHLERMRAMAACTAEGDAIEDTWSAEARDAIRLSLVGTRGNHALEMADKVVPWIDAYALTWRTHATEACMNANVHDTWDSSTLDKARWCLQDGRLELETLLAELAKGDERILHAAVHTAADLPPTASCIDASVLARASDPLPLAMRPQAAKIREKVMRARHLSAASRFDESLALATDALSEAQALAPTPLVATARARRASALGDLGRHAEAEAEGITAFMEASRASAWDVAALAAIDLVDLVGYRQSRFAEGRTWGELAAVATSHSADPLGLQQAQRANALGNVDYANGAYADAKAHYEQALALFEDVFGPNHPQVAVALNNIGNALDELGDYSAALAVHERALAIRKEVLGSRHPKVAGSLLNLAAVLMSTSRFDEAIVLYEESLSIRRESLGSDHSAIAMTLQNLGAAHLKRGDDDQARASLEQALAMRERAGSDTLEIASVVDTLGLLARRAGDDARARTMHERSLAIRERYLGEEHPDVATSLHNLGSVCTELGEHDAAVAHFERALVIRQAALERDHPKVALTMAALGGALQTVGEYARAIAELEQALAIERGEPDIRVHASFQLARALWDAPPSQGRDRPRALAVAREAAVTMSRSHPDREELDAWLAARARAATR